jgi:hypothetical protein
MQSSKKNSAEKEMLAPPWVRYLSQGGPGGHCRYPEDRVPPRTSSRSRQNASSGTATCPADPAPAARPGAAPGPPRVLWTQLPLPGPGQPRGHHVSRGPSCRCPARGRHVSRGPSSHCPARGSSRAATCPADPAPAARPGAALGPPRVPWTQLPLPDPGQLRGRCVSCGLSSCCPSRGSSGVATCAVEVQRSVCY